MCIPTGILKETRGYVSSTDQVNRNFRLETLDYRIFSNIYDLILTDGIVLFLLGSDSYTAGCEQRFSSGIRLVSAICV